ncbi:MAG TPA: hypothetical protein VGO43_15340 [Pyrinomonadaceae bacterium]|jgi:hypothetical protein|nr:hypothetical protein [Pyrinomonadaceae bacterium]
MTNTSQIRRYACLVAFAAAIVFLSGHFFAANAQRDPFKKAGWATPKKIVVGGTAKAPAPPVNYGPPPIEARIEYFKRMREQAAAAGNPLPKVTSVLTLNEMAVSGIFKTPRGYAAMVQATPINLSYTIYPGEKFFDGQLVAVEENRLIFRRVTKVGEGKFVASVENKPLRQFSMRAQVEGTAPTQPSDKPAAEKQVETAANNPQPAEANTTADPKAPKTAKVKAPSNPFLSPLDEMNSMPEKKESEKDKKAPKKPAKVAKNGQKP